MLVLTRRTGEEIVIAGSVRVVVLSCRGEKVRLGIVAPPGVCVDRLEVHARRTASPGGAGGTPDQPVIATGIVEHEGHGAGGHDSCSRKPG
jgi:carbon storage regulator